MGEPIRAIIAEPSRLLREALQRALSGTLNLEVVGEAASRTETIHAVVRLEPDVALLALTLLSTNGSNGSDLIAEIRQRAPRTRTLIVGGSLDDARLVHALRKGAWGYLGDDAGISDLAKAIGAIARGEPWLGRSAVARLLFGNGGSSPNRNGRPQPAGTPCTARELEVLRRLASGGTNKEIADALRISVKTVKNHLTTIFRKAGVSSRIQAVLYALNQPPD